jgi:hypothetical protein
MLNIQKIAGLSCLVVTFLLPGLAQAQSFILDTGTPPSSPPAEYTIGGSSSIAVEFAANAGQQVTQLAAYLAPGTGGSNFTFDIYSSLRTSGNRVSATYVDTGTFTGGTGWVTSNANWTVPTTGDYWLALQGSTGNNFDAPAETGTTTGTVPALGFASASSSSFYYATGNYPIGVEITATPEPSSWLLALVCIGTFAGLRRAVQVRVRR